MLISMTSYANFEKDGYSMFIQDGGICLSSVIGEIPENLVVPDSIEYEGTKYPVIKLGGGLYMYHNEIKKVTIPATVTFMGTGALGYCDNLTEIVIENGENAINCYGNTFVNSPIERLYLGRELKPENAYDVLFSTSLKYFTVGANVPKLPYCYSVQGLKSLIIEDAQESCEYAIQIHADTIYVGRNMVSDGRSIHGAFSGKCKSLTIGSNVTDIYNYCFSNFSINEFILPSSVTRLRRDAFYNCYINNMKIKYSDSPLNLDSYDAFYRAEIDSIYLGRQILYSDNSYGAFSPKTWYVPTMNNVLKYVYMDDNVTMLSRAAFRYSDALKYVRISPYVETIPGLCFDHAYMNNLVMPECLKTVEYSAFSNSRINVADFSNTKLETIENNAFNCALGLTTVILPETIKQIGDQAFAWCSELKEIIIYSEEVPTIEDKTFYNTTLANITLKVPESMVEKYKNDPLWKRIINIVPFETDGIPHVVIKNLSNKREYDINGIHSNNRDILIISPTPMGYKKHVRKNR